MTDLEQLLDMLRRAGIEHEIYDLPERTPEPLMQIDVERDGKTVSFLFGMGTQGLKDIQTSEP